MNRRDLLGLGVNLGVLASTGALSLRDARAATASRYAPAFERLDQYVEQYLREMNAPGLTLALSDASGVQRVCAYGFEDLEQRLPLDPARLFHIGSISKSFLGRCLVQLHEAGKLDFHRPIQDYLPWLRFDAATGGAPLTAHHLLTHSAALPDGALFPADPSWRYQATAAPGTFFHYCNMGYEALGLLLASLDGGTLADSLQQRILTPLGMSSSEPVITLDAAERIATAYLPRYTDRPYPRRGTLTRSPPIAFNSAAGCVAATARDMGAYLTMLIQRGATPTGRLVSPAGFALFCGRHMAAEHFGPGTAYGYGIAADQLEGHQRLRHTGGMAAFASALEVDLEAGVGGFASINAMQGYRPRPVVDYALRLMRACREGTALPPVPAPAPPLQVTAAADYAGRYTGESGGILEVLAAGDRLYLQHQGTRVPLEPSIAQPDAFTILHPDFAHFPLLFGRNGQNGTGTVVEAGWGPDWYTQPAYSGPRSFKVPDHWPSLTGEYRTEDLWIGSRRIVLRKGQLWMDGAIPLEPAAGGRFFLRDEPDSPEWVSFRETVNGKARALVLSGLYLPRV